MEELSKDLRYEIANQLDDRDLGHFCQLKREFSEICKPDSDYWLFRMKSKIEKEYIDFALKNFEAIDFKNEGKSNRDIYRSVVEFRDEVKKAQEVVKKVKISGKPNIGPSRSMKRN